MKKYKLLFFVFICCCFSAISQKKIKTYFKDVSTLELKSQEVKIINNQDIFFSNIIAMNYIDDLLILTDQDPTYAMKIVDLRTNTVRNFGRKGRGPNELQRNISIFSTDYVTRKLYVNDLPNYCVYAIDSLKKGIDDQVLKFKIPVGKESYLSSTYCNGNIVGSTFINRIGIYNIKTKKSFGKFAYAKGGAMVHQSSFYSHPSKNKVAFLESFSEKMGIYTINDNDIELEELPWDEKSKSKTTTSEGKTFARHYKLGFIHATTSEKYIYSLYSGKPYSDSESFFQASTTDIIYVFDWDAKPIKKIQLDQKVRTISIDKKNNILYASAYNEGIPYLIKYELK